MIDYVRRLAGPFTGAGQSTFSFSFKIFDPTDVYVATALTDTDASTNLVYDTDFWVDMNDDQNSTPGGTVTLAQALVGSQVVVIGSAIAYTQNVQLTNYSRFPPEIINEGLDRIVVQIQQLVEQTGRTLKVPATSSTTPEEMIEKLLAAQDDARQFADAAQRSAEEARAIEQRLTSQEGSLANELAAEGKRQLQAVKAEGQKQSQAVVAEGDAQVARIKTAGDATLNAQGGGCIEVSWTADKAVSAGTPIKLPHGAQFIVGRHHVRLAWNGLVLYGGTYFSEVGEANKFSSELTLTFDLRQGDEMNAWISTLGSADASEAIATAVAAEQAVADLSRKVVYKNEQAAKE